MKKQIRPQNLIRMNYKLYIFSLIPLLAMCQPIVTSVKNSRRVSNENRAKEYKDFDDSTHIGQKWQPKMNFKIGDRFRLKQPMYIHQDVTGGVQLAETSLFTVPKPAKYRKNPELYRFGGDNVYQVIRLVPKGTVIQFVASKSSGGEGAIYYFVIAGTDDWFRCASFKCMVQTNTDHHTNGPRIFEYAYNNELFEKM